MPRRKDLRRIGRWAAAIPDPVARLSYLRRSTAVLPERWLRQRRKIPWIPIVTVGGAAVVLAGTILLWRSP